MAGSDADDRKGLSAVPSGFEGIMEWVPSAHPLIKGVIVERWTIEKGNLIRKQLFSIYRSLPEATRKAIWKMKEEGESGDDDSLDIADILFSVVDKVDEEFDQIIELSVIPEHRDRIGKMFYEEKFDLITAVLKTNPSIIPKLKKKGKEWRKLFTQMWTGTGESSP